MTKDQQRSAGMKLGGHNQHAMRADRLQASARVIGLRKCRKANNGTYRDAASFRQAIHILLCYIDESQVVDTVICLGIEKSARHDSLSQQFQRVFWTGVRLPGEDHYGIRLLWFVHHQEASRLA